MNFIREETTTTVSWRTLTRILKAVKLTVLAQDITDTLSEA